jgi:hypothetical protein
MHKSFQPSGGESMRRILQGLFVAVVAFALSPGALPASQDHDHGKHAGGDKHDPGDRDDRHDNGKHKGWDNPHNPHYDHWDYDHDRYEPGHRYPHGRYPDVRHRWVARTFDVRTRRVILDDRSTWVVASYDVSRCRGWAWDRDDVFVYDDDHHPGWYLLFNARLGQYIHVEYFGGR